MDLEFSADEIAFRDEVRLWMQQNVPKDNSPLLGIPNEKETQFNWERRLGEKGWLAYQWPKEFGGPGWTATQRFIFDTERALAGAPASSPFGLMMLAPVLMKFGSPEQQERYLPPIARGEEFWCQGYSEPGAGSDLASLKTKAVRDSDHYRVNGQKIWTTQAHWAKFMFCLVRTDTEGAKQRGISFLLIDMNSPGIEIRPITTIDGHHHLNEVFLTDVEVPVENLVGEEGQGWTIAKYLLTHERTGIAGVADSQYELGRLKSAVERSSEMSDDAVAKRRISGLEIELMALNFTNLRTLDRIAKGQPPGAESSGLKIKGTELQQAISQAQVEFGGTSSLPWLSSSNTADPVFAASAQRYNFLRASTIYGGSNEIQKNVLAKMLLGLG